MNAIELTKFPSGIAAALFAMLLVATPAEAALNGATQPPAVAEAFFQRAKLAPEARQRMEQVLHGREALLGYLPVTQLECVKVEARGFELVFDFGKKDEMLITIPAEKLWVLDKGRMLEVESEERVIVVNKRIHVTLDEKGGLHVREGDLKYSVRGPDPDLTAHAFRSPNRQVCDDKGRVVLKLDAEGRPLLENGRPIARTADEWLVIECWAGKVELPL